MMKSKIIISLIFIIGITFSYGLVVGHYHFFPFEILSDFNKIIQNQNTKLEPRPQIYQDISQINDLITITSKDDIERKKYF